MAQLDLNNIEKLEKLRNTVHEKVYTTYTCFEQDNEKYVQLDTYGKSDRDTPGKISQSIQLNRETAKFLVELLSKEYEFEF